MVKAEFHLPDTFRILAEGQESVSLLSAAAMGGLRFRHVRMVKHGISFTMTGRDYIQLGRLAARQGVRLRVIGRRGPGTLFCRIWARPGLWIGAVLFCLLVCFLSGFVWRIDFGTLDGEQAAEMRALLADAGLCEGSRVSGPALQTARDLAATQSDRFGWITLNFSGGCLAVESTPYHRQEIRTDTPETALYAAADAEIIQIRVESGFARVAPGQYVAEGQLLANGIRNDRNGEPVYQTASGSVFGRMHLKVDAEQPLQQQLPVLTGQHAASATLCLLGFRFPLQKDQAPLPDGILTEEWMPLTLGELALPGCLHTITSWTQTLQTVTHTPAAAEALARRNCYLKLRSQWPDAVIEEQSFFCEQTETAVTCRAEFVFCADIARPGLAVPEMPTVQG